MAKLFTVSQMGVSEQQQGLVCRRVLLIADQNVWLCLELVSLRLFLI